MPRAARDSVQAPTTAHTGFCGVVPINTQAQQKRVTEPFRALDGSNYSAAYRAVYDFHSKHNPPRLDGDDGEKYWRDLADDMALMAADYNHDSFICGMLHAVYEELERQYKILRMAANDR